MSEPNIFLIPETVIDGRFAVERVIGVGGTAIVVAARHVKLRTRVAIKMLRAEYADNTEVVTRFIREARAAARIKSPHAVSIVDVGMLPNSKPFIVMEYLAGHSLAQLLEELGSLPIPKAIDYILQTMVAISDAHRLGIVHRDIKPGNIVLTGPESDFPTIKVIDFGISKLIESDSTTIQNITVMGSVLGSLAYMSPEQFRDPSQVSYQTDIWSIGVTLYELLANRLPFEADTGPAFLSMICHESPNMDALREVGCSEQLVAIVERCLAKDLNDRFGSIQELARSLLPFAHFTSSQHSIEQILRVSSSIPPAILDISPEGMSEQMPGDTLQSSLPPIAAITATTTRRRALLTAILGCTLVCLLLCWVTLVPSPNAPRGISGVNASVGRNAELSDSQLLVRTPRNPAMAEPEPNSNDLDASLSTLLQARPAVSSMPASSGSHDQSSALNHWRDKKVPNQYQKTRVIDSMNPFEDR